MTQQGAVELYMYMTAAWPLVVKPGASEAWRAAKVKEIFVTYREFTDAEVHEAWQKWTAEQEKFPTTKNIINEIRWMRARRTGKKIDPTKLYTMDRIYDDGTEVMVAVGNKATFTWDEFVNLPCNPDHIDPEEWERRFRIRRKQVLEKLEVCHG